MNRLQVLGMHQKTGEFIFVEFQSKQYPKALMTLKEFLMDYASEDTKAIGEKLIEAELANIPKDKVREICKDHLDQIEQGIRDFRF